MGGGGGDTEEYIVVVALPWYNTSPFTGADPVEVMYTNLPVSENLSSGSSSADAGVYFTAASPSDR